MISFFKRTKRTARERHFGRTPDGWTIALHRLTPSNPTEGRLPILLCHGLGANRFNLDAPGDKSIAEWLRSCGYDCWVIELRGAGYSSRPSKKNGLEWSWTFDDYVNHDIPTALSVIERVTGYRQVHWLGHSLGGMIAYAYLITHGDERIRSLVTVGSPSFSRLSNGLFDRVLGLRNIVKFLPKMPYEGTGVLLVPVMPVFKETVGWLFGHPRNMQTKTLSQLIRVLPSDLPTTLVLQLADWYEEGGFADATGTVNYCDELEKIKVPSLLIVGEKDLLTPPADIRVVFDGIRSEDKRLDIVGTSSGCRYDYGHIDPILGRWAPEEIWPSIRNWFDRQSEALTR